VVDWIEHDLAKPLDSRKLPGQVDTIIHLAQSQVYREFPDRAQEIFEVNVSGTLRLLEYARNAKAEQFIFAGSGGVYQYRSRPIVESDPIHPLSFYLSSKYAAEILMRNYEQFFSAVVLRFFFVYGPGQQQGMLVPSLTRKVVNQESVTVEGNPGIRINPTYVGDAVRAIEASLALPTSCHINVAGDEVVTITDLVRHIGQVTGKDVCIQHTATEAAGDLVADTTRMKTILGVSPQVPLREGLQYAAEH
jgi:nucleoside-diphosphate-sugar epimerase